ncbi:tRNA dihydrouridine synthase [Aureococcus anophagefferens]|nr:tRNA dihydrouridine synthase [Aureococcus anophagefferens]
MQEKRPMGCRLSAIVVLFSIGTRAEYFYPAIDEAERWDDVVKPVVVRGYRSSCEADETCAAAPGLDACVAGAGEERSLGSPGWRSASRYDVRDEVHVQRAGQTRVVVAPPTRDVTRRTGLVPRLHAHAGETLVPLGAAASLGEHARAAILYPGDAFFIPAYWLREKRALNDSCSLSTYAESASGRAADGVASVALDGLLLERYTPAMRSRLLTRFLAALTFEFQLDRLKIDDLGEWIWETESPRRVGPAALARAAALVAATGHCDAVELNMGCPQRCAKKTGSGAFLMEDPARPVACIKAMRAALDAHNAGRPAGAPKVACVVKIRCFDDVARTLALAAALERAGAQMLTVHGRTRHAGGGRRTAAQLANWTGSAPSGSARAFP